ncbi:MAG: addiction module protein [Methylococcales bacterium]
MPTIDIQIEKLTAAEKIQMMESLWDSLCAQPENIQSPAWHSEVLKDREEALGNGSDSFMDWDVAKKHIRNELP